MTIKSLHKEILQWSYERLSFLGYTLKNSPPETVVSTPWSYVARFATAEGYLYLKHTPARLALEAPIIQILQDQFHAPVPTVIAHNTELHCFLMKDAGRPLRSILKQQFDTELLCKAIDQFTSLQCSVAERADVFLEKGVPDWRLNQLPNVYKEVISQKELLIADGLSEMESDALEALIPKISQLCQKLSDYSIKPTLVQPDFHDNNILIEETSQKITFIDLGEISISHPFFSLLNCLQQIRKHHALTEEEERYLRIQEACFHDMPKDAVAIAQTLWPLYQILAQYRLMTACGKEEIMRFQTGRLSNSVRMFIRILSA